MKRTLATAAILAALLTAAAAPAAVLWDQSDCDTVGMSSWFDSVSGCFPFGSTVHAANDIHVWDHVTIQRITTWYTPFNFDTGSGTQAYLYVAPKTGALPVDGTDLPQEGATLVDITVTQNPDNGMWVVVADGLSMPLTPGDYWVSLTPILPSGPWGGDTHLRALTAWGGPSAYYEYCGESASTWLAVPDGADLSLLIEGTVDIVPAETTTWGGAKALFR